MKLNSMRTWVMGKGGGHKYVQLVLYFVQFPCFYVLYGSIVSNLILCFHSLSNKQTLETRIQVSWSITTNSESAHEVAAYRRSQWNCPPQNLCVYLHLFGVLTMHSPGATMTRARMHTTRYDRERYIRQAFQRYHVHYHPFDLYPVL